MVNLTVGANSNHKVDLNLSILYFYGFLFLLSIACYFVPIFLTFEKQFWFLTGIVAFHNLYEFIVIYRKTAHHFWIKPVILTSITLFFLQHGALTNFLYRDTDGSFYQTYNRYLIREPIWLNRTMALVLAGSVMYWLGYKLNIGQQLTNAYMRIYGRFWNLKVPDYKLLWGLIIGWIFKLILNAYGAIGHRIGYVIKEAGHVPGYIYRFKIFENVSLLFTVCFLFLAIKYKTNRFYWMVFFLGLGFEIIFAATSGARSTIIFVFLAVFLVDYFHHGYLRWIWVAGGIGILVLAMTILKDFKDFALKQPGEASQLTDPLAYIKSANNYRDQIAKGVKADDALRRSMFLTAVGRFNYVNEASQVMRYKKVIGLKESDPDFLGPFFTFPLYAVVPRFWVLGKSTESYGSWVTHLLIRSRKFSVAMSPLGYSYMTAGPVLVCLVFFLIGILTKALEKCMAWISGVGAFILFLALLKVIVLFDTVVWASLLNVIRYGLLFPPILWALLKKW